MQMRLTKIAGKYYDLSSFRHPGGDTALWHAYGRDATVLFRSHHPFASEQRLAATLAKYEVAPPSPGRASLLLLPGEEDAPQFRFDSAFARELRRGVREYFEGLARGGGTTLADATKATPWRWLLIGVLSCLRVACFWHWLRGHWLALIAHPLATWLGGSNTFHDACHFALSANQSVNALVGYTYPSLTSPLAWYHQHNIGHHAYTNVAARDPDLYHMKALQRTTPTTAYRPAYAYQRFTAFIGWAASYIGLAIYPSIESAWRGTYFEIVPSVRGRRLLRAAEVAHVLCAVGASMLPLVLFDDAPKAWLFVVVPHIVHSALFMLNSQITHLHTACMTREEDWFKHQVLTAANHGGGSWPHFVFSGGLNHQIEHHLFPSVNHCHHPHLRPIVKRVCAKHGVAYREFGGYREAFASYYQHVVRMGRKGSGERR